MLPLHKYTLAIGIFQGLILFVLLMTDKRVSSSGRVLGILCLFLALFMGFPFIASSGPESRLFWTAGWLFYLPASMGGLAYIYCRNSILAEKFSPVQLLHLTPLLICYLLVADYIAFSPEKFVQWVNGGGYNSRRLTLSEYVIFAQAFVYAAMTLHMIAEYRRRSNDKLANFNPKIFRWLTLFMGILLCVWVIKAVFAFSPYFNAAIYHFSDMVIVALIYIIAATQWRNPQFLNIHPHGEEKLSTKLAKKKKNANDPSGVLDPEMRANLFSKVKETIETNELFKDNNLTLLSLANKTGLKLHHLSEVINQQAGKNFYQFINTYRVDYVCHQFQKDKKGRILDIALDAGFSSKSTFNAIFKQFKGMTPSEYREKFVKMS